MEELAIQLAQKQLDAYNSQNLEEFLSVYSEDVEVLEFPTNKQMYKGIERMRERYEALFKNNPNQHAKLLTRMAKGNIVIDHEYVTGRTNEIEVTAIAMYEIKGNKIGRVWFVK
ncbi:MAG TPA: nuclear transport factor 2 family protein [Bacillus sp. (in: firmicutes)]|uniref:nuclear transport factor 2 family protein n=1 Tax=Bacillus litorisediminis TaxID=2922713 RepID=UPI001FAB9045|nr:nuclear transport factor 2 family protein [Bacillus litorisediminis]HWO76256.1 nuclear transport factor 2 family protein [Bacillus sp. (in: firmicutes)]